MYILERSLNLCGQIGFCGKNIYFSRAAPHSPIPFSPGANLLQLSWVLLYFIFGLLHFRFGQPQVRKVYWGVKLFDWILVSERCRFWVCQKAKKKLTDSNGIIKRAASNILVYETCSSTLFNIDQKKFDIYIVRYRSSGDSSHMQGISHRICETQNAEQRGHQYFLGYN